MRALLLAALMAGTAWAQTEVVEAKTAAAPARFEVTLQPVRVQVNGKFTQHLGTFATVSWSPREHVALQLLGGGNWYNEESRWGVRDPGYTPISDGCRGFVDPNEAGVGFALSRFPSSDVIHNLGLALGAGFTF